MVMSSVPTSATRRSRSDFDASAMADAAAFSQDSLLVPTSSITLYTLSAIAGPPLDAEPNSLWQRDQLAVIVAYGGGGGTSLQAAPWPPALGMHACPKPRPVPLQSASVAHGSVE